MKSTIHKDSTKCLESEIHQLVEWLIVFESVWYQQILTKWVDQMSLPKFLASVAQFSEEVWCVNVAVTILKVADFHTLTIVNTFHPAIPVWVAESFFFKIQSAAHIALAWLVVKGLEETQLMCLLSVLNMIVFIPDFLGSLNCLIGISPDFNIATFFLDFNFILGILELRYSLRYKYSWDTNWCFHGRTVHHLTPI